MTVSAFFKISGAQEERCRELTNNQEKGLVLCWCHKIKGEVGAGFRRHQARKATTCLCEHIAVLLSSPTARNKTFSWFANSRKEGISKQPGQSARVVLDVGSTYKVDEWYQMAIFSVWWLWLICGLAQWSRLSYSILKSTMSSYGGSFGWLGWWLGYWGQNTMKTKYFSTTQISQTRGDPHTQFREGTCFGTLLPRVLGKELRNLGPKVVFSLLLLPILFTCFLFFSLENKKRIHEAKSWLEGGG